MDAIFEPALLFISDSDWADEEKRDFFLDSLICHLENIHKYDICQILWSHELLISLLQEPTNHPWHQSDLKNSLIPVIHKYFFSRHKIIQSHDEACEISPDIQNNFFDQSIFHIFLKLIHTLLDTNQLFYFCIIKNQTHNQSYEFNCKCGNSLSPIIIRHCGEWLSIVDVVERFFPVNLFDFDSNLRCAMDLIRKVSYQNRPILHDYKFSNHFKRDVINASRFKDKILKIITLKLILSGTEAQRNRSLNQEFIDQRKEYRIRVTNRPHSTRIHFLVEESNRIVFLRYYDVGQHDCGL
jgi:hypothetical protein